MVEKTSGVGITWQAKKKLPGSLYVKEKFDIFQRPVRQTTSISKLNGYNHRHPENSSQP
jgi:hypothetical protein